MIDYKGIINNLKDEAVINLMKQLGAVNYIEKDDCIIFPTICHNASAEEASMKLYYYRDSHLFMCYTEDGAMSIFKFLKTYYETRQIEYDWFKDIYEVVTNCSTYVKQDFINTSPYESLKDRYRARKAEKVLPIYPNGLMDMFTKKYPIEWLNDGITKETMDKYNIRFSISQNKIVIPHYDYNGNLVGIRGRALNKEEVELLGKYMPMQIQNKWYTHPLSLNLYGLNYNKNNIKNYGICYVGEAEKFVLQSESFSFPNCSVAVCGSQFNKYQLDLLLRVTHPREIVICFDKEEKQNQTIYYEKLRAICEKYKNYCRFSFIYDRNNLLELKESPTDRGQKVFEKLLEGRIFVT